LAVNILNFLVQNKQEIVGVFCHPDASEEKLRNQLALKKSAKNYGLKIYQPKGLRNEEYVKLIRSLNPDIILSVFYKFIIPKEIIEIPSLGCINLHGGLLPEYRGNFPGVWSIINGEKYAGLTMHFIDSGIDTGDIIDMESVKIAIADTGKTLYDKLTDAGLKLFKRQFLLLAAGKIKRIKQDESKARYYPKRTVEDNKINWDADNLKVYNFIRGVIFPPYLGPYTFFGKDKIEVAEVWLKERTNYATPSGIITNITPENYVEVSSGNGTIVIKKIKYKGKIIKAAYYRGFKIGESFET